LTADENVVLVGHSLGYHAISRWAEREPADAARVKGAMLVAAPDIDSDSCYLRDLLHFSGVRPCPLPFPAILVASENDPYASMDAHARPATLWGTMLINTGRAGHINVDSGHGAWPRASIISRVCSADSIHQLA
jgi:hypothetical protein